MSGFNPIINNDSGLVARTKLNEMLEELFDALVEQLWVDDDGTIKPKDDAPVELVNLVAQVIETASLETTSANITTELLLSFLTGTYSRMLSVDTDGTVSSKSFGFRQQTDLSANTVLDLTYQAVYVSATSVDVTLTLPTATAATKGHSYNVNKITGNYGVIITAAGGQAIAHSTGVSGSYTLTSRGEWAMIRSIETAPGTYGWMIEQFGGRATTGGGGVTRGVIEIDSSELTEYNIETTYLNVRGTGNANIDLFLPSNSSVGIIDFVIRKTGGTGALSLFTSGGDQIELDGDTGEGIYTVTIGAWVRVMSDGAGMWYVISDNDEFEMTSS